MLTKILNVLLIIIIVILITMSGLALTSIHILFLDKAKYSFSFSPLGINTYLNGLGEFKALFTATVATIAAYYGLLRFKVAADQNRDKLKQDRFLDWKTVLDMRYIRIEKSDPYMKQEFTRIRYHYFNQLYNLKFKISSNAELTQIFNETFQDLVKFFETQNTNHLALGGFYNDTNHSYSYDSFRYLFVGCVDSFYPEIFNDLKSLYMANLFSNRIINAEMYKAAVKNYNPGYAE